MAFVSSSLAIRLGCTTFVSLNGQRCSNTISKYIAASTKRSNIKLRISMMADGKKDLEDEDDMTKKKWGVSPSASSAFSAAASASVDSKPRKGIDDEDAALDKKWEVSQSAASRFDVPAPASSSEPAAVQPKPFKKASEEPSGKEVDEDPDPQKKWEVSSSAQSSFSASAASGPEPKPRNGIEDEDAALDKQWEVSSKSLEDEDELAKKSWSVSTSASSSFTAPSADAGSKPQTGIDDEDAAVDKKWEASKSAASKFNASSSASSDQPPAVDPKPFKKASEEPSGKEVDEDPDATKKWSESFTAPAMLNAPAPPSAAVSRPKDIDDEDANKDKKWTTAAAPQSGAGATPSASSAPREIRIRVQRPAPSAAPAASAASPSPVSAPTPVASQPEAKKDMPSIPIVPTAVPATPSDAAEKKAPVSASTTAPKASEVKEPEIQTPKIKMPEIKMPDFGQRFGMKAPADVKTKDASPTPAFTIPKIPTPFGGNSEESAAAKMTSSTKAVPKLTVTPAAPSISGSADYFTDKDNFSRYQFYPQNAFLMAMRNFQAESVAILSEVWEGVLRLAGKGKPEKVPDTLNLVLSDDVVSAREKYREEVLGKNVDVPVFVRFLYDSLCFTLDLMFKDRPIQRFWFLETVARVPYFSYVSILHLYETLGWWRDAKLINMHSEEASNEFIHLLTMEALGGNRQWRDRFVAEHLAIVYYWVIVILFMVSPSLSYRFSELVEGHAVDTYEVFLEQNAETLKLLPAPACAQEYYNMSALSKDRGMGMPRFSFSDYSGASYPEEQVSDVTTLYDVFKNIVTDEKQHVRAMQACGGLSMGQFAGIEGDEIKIDNRNKK